MSQETLKLAIEERLVPLLPSGISAAVYQRADYLAALTIEDINNKATLDVNKSIGTIQTNLIGSYNPVNIVSSNMSPQTLTSNIGSLVQNNIISPVVDTFYSNLDSIITNNIKRNADYSLESIRTSTSTTVTQFLSIEIASSIEDVAVGLFSKTTNVSDILGGLFDTVSGVDLDNIAARFSSLIGAEALSRAANFRTLNSDNIDKLNKTSTGFVDPTGTYPREEYKDSVDTNKLAQGDIKGTVVQQKDKERVTASKLPGGNSWDQPKSTFKGQYPYNKVHQTESGHIVEFDDTPGAERIHIYHKSGTFIEIDSNGSVISRTKGSDYKIIDCNGYVSIQGKANVSVNGECNIFVGSDANIEVGGSAYINSKNDIEINASGRLQLSAAEAIDMRSPLIYVEADQEFHLTAETKANIQGNVINVKSDTNLNIGVGRDANFKTEGILKVESVGDANIKSGANLNLQAASDGNLKAGGQLAMDSGGNTLINQGASTDAVEAGPSEEALYSESGLPDVRVDNVETIIPDPVALNIADQHAIQAETQTDDTAAIKNQLVLNGLTTNEELNQIPIVSESTTGSTSNASLILADDSLKGMTSIPDNFQLSPHFTLGMLSSKAAISKGRVVTQRGLSYGQIVYNLQILALNVLEPIYNVYPDMLVTSGFRSAESSSSTSQHPLGMAVDIQFKGVQKNEYYKIAEQIKDLIIFDQLLLEYTSYGNVGCWLHISLDSTKQRKQIMTFYNHSKYAEGLNNLA